MQESPQNEKSGAAGFDYGFAGQEGEPSVTKKSEFGKILAEAKNITDEVYRDPVDYQMGDVISLFVHAKIPEQELRSRVDSCAKSFADWDGKELNILCQLEEWGKSPDYFESKSDLFAIDATDSPLISLMIGQFYEVVVGGIGYSGDGFNHTIHRASAVKTIESIDSAESLNAFIDSLGSSVDRSWPNTFREYKEREFAVDCESVHVIVDGPILTQNLITQQEGRELIESIDESNKKVVGVIKNLGSSTPIERWIGRILNEGEAFVICSCQDLLSNRQSESWANSKAIRPWLNNCASKYCRGVYRPGNPEGGKSHYFGFECKIEHLPWALSVLYQERSSVIGHEIPFLLDLVDARLDSCHDRGSVQKRLEAGLMQYDPSQAFDEIDSDEFRGK